MWLSLLTILSSSLEMLAGLLALISPAPVVSLLLGMPVDWIAAVLTRPFGERVFSLGLACLKVRNDVQSPASLAVSIGITFYNALTARYSLHCNRGGPGRPVVVGSGDCPLGFDVLFLSILAGTRR